MNKKERAQAKKNTEPVYNRQASGAERAAGKAAQTASATTRNAEREKGWVPREEIITERGHTRARGRDGRQGRPIDGQVRSSQKKTFSREKGTGKPGIINGNVRKGKGKAAGKGAGKGPGFEAQIAGDRPPALPPGGRLSRKALGRAAVLLLLLTLVGVGAYAALRPRVLFAERTPRIEAGTSYDAAANIRKVRGGQPDQVVIDESALDTNRIGRYEIRYHYQERTYPLTVEVVDTIAPEFEIKEGEIDLGMTPDAAALVEQITDVTATTVSFDQTYSFDQAGDYRVRVTVRDAAGNHSEKETVLHVLPRDEIPPQLGRLREETYPTGVLFDAREGVTLSDNQDPHPSLEVDERAFDADKPGDYTIRYTARDRSGNVTTAARIIHIIERKTIGRDTPSEKKIVYLTFDDGPSENTGRILKVLNHYGVKATFFVTGNGQEYNHLIKQAHDHGHTIALHTYSHDYGALYASVADYFADLNRVGDMVREITGEFPRYIRFPGGSSNTISRDYSEGIMSQLSEAVINRGFQYYDWNVDSGDASANHVSPKKIFHSATSTTSDNPVILFHDTDAKDTTVEALPGIIEYYQKHGYAFAAINDDSYTAHHGINN